MRGCYKVQLTVFCLVFGCLILTGGTCADDGKTGAPGTPAMSLEYINVESCALCHKDHGKTKHQDIYTDYSDTSKLVAAITNVVSAQNGSVYDVTVTFTLTYDGAPYTAGTESYTASSQTRYRIKGLDQQTGYWIAYAAGATPFLRTGAPLNDAALAYTYTSGTATATNNLFFGSKTASDITHAGNGVYNVKARGLTTNPATLNFAVYMYFAKGIITNPTLTLYSNVANVAKVHAGTIGYASNADVAGCAKCHGTPYMKHGYRAPKAYEASDGTTGGLPDFAACKNCHYDDRVGGSSHKQEFFGDPNYNYTANVITEVHATHMNHFPYPQSMKNCVTCHPTAGGKLTNVLNNTNFTKAICETCHPNVSNPTTNTVAKKHLTAIYDYAKSKNGGSHTDFLTANPTCTTCHTGGATKSFSEIHTGYDTTKYTSAANAESGTLKYTYAIDNITYNSTTKALTITWSASDGVTALNVLNQTTPATTGAPIFLGNVADRKNGTAYTTEGIRILVGYYGWGTHNIADYDNYTKSSILTNTTYDSGTGKATTVVTLGTKLDTYKSTKVEVGIIGVPIVDASNTYYAVKSVTKGIVLSSGAIEDRDTVYKITDNAKCNTCHSNLVMHTGDSHGHTAVGNVNACGICHNTANAAGHYDHQGRSIDSYLHAIHSFQPVNAAYNPVNEEFVFPMFTTRNCEACHNSGKYEVPSQKGTMASSGSLIDSDNNTTTDDVTVGPGARACGSCHRAMFIKESKLDLLRALNDHTKINGYRLPKSTADYPTVMNKIYDILK